VPWIKGNGQRGFKDEDIPKDQEKKTIVPGRKKELLLKNGNMK
jgi:oxygen-independent coproporphyrinogen-3 oxidase